MTNSKKSHKKPVHIRVDTNVWEQVQSRVPGLSLSETLEKLLAAYLSELIESEIDLNTNLKDAAFVTITETS